MEDELQIIEKFDSSEWKDLVKRNVFTKTRWDIDVDFTIRRDVLHFQATFKVIETTYTMSYTHHIYRVTQIGSDILTQYVLQSFINNIRKFENTGKHLEEYKLHVQKNLLTYDYPDLYCDNGDV